MDLLVNIVIFLEVYIIFLRGSTLLVFAFSNLNFLIQGKIAEVLIDIIVFYRYLGVILVFRFFSEAHGAHVLHPLHHHLGSLIKNSASSKASKHHGRIELIHAVEAMNALIHIFRASATPLVDLGPSFIVIVLLTLQVHVK